MKQVVFTALFGVTLLSSCQNNREPDAKALLDIAQKAKEDTSYCIPIPEYAPQIVGHTFEISNFDRMSRGFRYQAVADAGLITIKQITQPDPDNLNDYQERITPSPKMLEIARSVRQPAGNVICTGDLKITDITDVQKAQNGVIQAKATYTFTPKAWNTPDIAKLFYLKAPETSGSIAFQQMQDNSWKLATNQ